MKPLPAVTAACLTVLLVACVETSSESMGGVVVDSAGVRIIELTDVPIQQRRTLILDPEWGPDRDLEIGRLTDVDVGTDGRIILLDEMNGRVTVLSPEGMVETSFGRFGEGPGEFGGFLRSVVSTDSTIFVPDLELQRITEFGRDGRVVTTRRIVGSAAPGEPVGAVDWRRYPAGGLAYREVTESGDLLLKWEGNDLDTLHVLPRPIRPPNPLLAPILLWDIDTATRIVTAQSDVGRVELWESVGQGPTWISSRQGIVREFGDAERDYVEQLLLAGLLGGQTGEVTVELRARILASVTFPERVPALAAVHTAPNGDVWVQRARAVAEMDVVALRAVSGEGSGGPVWDVLTPDGLLREVVLVPDGFTPRRFAEEWIYGIISDELGRQTVARVLQDN